MRPSIALALPLAALVGVTSACVVPAQTGSQGTTYEVQQAPPPPQTVVVAQPVRPQTVVVSGAPQPGGVVVVQGPQQPVYGGMVQSDASNYGVVRIQSGFLPDPTTANGTSGGAQNASSVGGSCRGWIANQPDHILYLDSPFNYLRIGAVSGQDTTLVIRGPAGVHCDDDTGGNRNPLLAGSFPAGRYEVWIGSYTQGTFAPYTLSLSERGNGGGVPIVPIYTGSAGVAPSAGDSNFGTVALATGFMPDPFMTNGTSGGQISAGSLDGSCRGWIAPRPDHILQANTAFNYLRVEGGSGEDTTLVIRGPFGLRCDDDSAGNRNPRVEGYFPPGRYEVWVGSYTQGTYAPYSLQFSEIHP